MVVRPAGWNDLEAISGILTRAFWEEDLCGRVMHPDREQHPDDVIKYWRAKTRLNYWTWSHELHVATDDHDRIVAVASWDLRGRLLEEAKPAWWDPRGLTEKAVTLFNSLEAWLSPNRAADPAMIGPPEILDRAGPFTSSYWEGERADGYYLELLAVDPAAQKRGYGRQLVEGGLDRARREAVNASVVSSYGSDPFYFKCGFDQLVGSALDGEGNPLKALEVKGGSILFLQPPAGQTIGG